MRLGVFVGRLVLSDLCHIFDSVFEDLALVGAEPVLARLGSALDELAGLDLTSRSGEQLLALLRGLEEHSRRLGGGGSGAGGRGRPARVGC